MQTAQVRASMDEQYQETLQDMQFSTSSNRQLLHYRYKRPDNQAMIAAALINGEKQAWNTCFHAFAWTVYSNLSLFRLK